MAIVKRGKIDPIGDHKAILKSVEAELWNIALDLESIANDYLKRKNISVDGDIKKSIKGLVEPILKGLRLEFGSNTPHAIFVHEGTKPHWAPVKPIKTWVKKKLNPPADRIGSVTWFVRKKIAEQGTPAKPFLAVAWRALKNQIPRRIESAIARAV